MKYNFLCLVTEHKLNGKTNVQQVATRIMRRRLTTAACKRFGKSTCRWQDSHLANQTGKQKSEAATAAAEVRKQLGRRQSCDVTFFR